MKRFLLCALLLSFASFAAPYPLQAKLVEYVVGFEQFSEALNADAKSKGSDYGWSWNNTTDRVYSGAIPKELSGESFYAESGSLELYYYGYKMGDLTLGSFTVDGVKFTNNYMGTASIGMYYWEGFGISNLNSTIYDNYRNDMASLTGTGAKDPDTGEYSNAYGIMFAGSDMYAGDGTVRTYIELPEGAIVSGMDIINTVYAYTSLLDGDGFAEPISERIGKYFELVVTGYDIDGDIIKDDDGKIVETLAQLGINTSDGVEIIEKWEWLDLSGLNGAVKLEFAFRSDEDSGYGINYPTYFAFDNLTYKIDDGTVPGSAVTPEPATLAIFGLGILGTAVFRRRGRK